MEWPETTFTGPAADDPGTLGLLPAALREILEETNGCVAFRGGLHLRGICSEPLWHSLEFAWKGDGALHRLYPSVRAEDIPFAQDCVGDQFLLRNGTVHRLEAETGEQENLDIDLPTFLERAKEDPEGFLGMYPLLKLEREGGKLISGEVIEVSPPFCQQDSDERTRFHPVPVLEHLKTMAEYAHNLSKSRQKPRASNS